MLLFCSSMMTGNHDATQVAGRDARAAAAARFRTGRVLDYLDKPNRKMCSLYLSMLDKCGVHLKQFGDSTERLAEV